MSRSSPVEDAIILHPLLFLEEKGKIFCISSKERDPISQLLPVLKGAVVIIAPYTMQHYEIPESCEAAVTYVRDLVEASLRVKYCEAEVTFIIDRIDEINTKATKMSRGLARSGFINSLGSYLKERNAFITTMIGDPGLYELVDKHYIV